MTHHFIPALILVAALIPACSQKGPVTYLTADPGAPMNTTWHGIVATNQGRQTLSVERGNQMGILVPDTNGGYAMVPGGQRPIPDQNHIEAQELKLKVRELAAQMLETWPNSGLTGMVAMPVSFVSLDNFDETSPLGRYLSEALIYEFNTRGFPVREYRTNGTISFKPGGEFVLNRASPSINAASGLTALVVGTYHRDPYGVFVNARMIRGSDGLVLRTAQVVLPMNPVVGRMTSIPPPNPLRMPGGGLKIVQGAR